VVCETRFLGHSLVHRLDPRVRIIAAVAFSVLIAVSGRTAPLLGGLAFALVLALLARLPLAPTLKRFASVNAFMLSLLVLLPLTVGGEPLLRLGPLAWSREGAVRAAVIALKCNTIVLYLTVLLSTMEPVMLGHALHRLGVPDKLSHLLLFTIRYVDLIHHEHQRLMAAVKVRCFRPRMSLHTYRTVAHFVGMLLVRSLDRSERIAAAMKCRCFSGRFFVLDNLALRGHDAVFAAASAAVLVALALSEWI